MTTVIAADGLERIDQMVRRIGELPLNAPFSVCVHQSIGKNALVAWSHTEGFPAVKWITSFGAIRQDACLREVHTTVVWLCLGDTC